MSLRGKVLGLFFLLAAVPLLALGLFEYTRSLRAVEDLVSVQNARIADRVVEAIEGRAAVLESDLLLLAENAETQRWLVAHADRLPDESAAAREGQAFLDNAWSRIGAGYAGLELTDAQGRVVLGASREGVTLPGNSPSWRPGLEPQERPVRDLRSHRVIGTIRLQPILEAMIPTTIIDAGFGDRGEGAIIDRSSGRVLWHPETSTVPRQAGEIFGKEFALATIAGARGSFRYRAGDDMRVASYASLASLPWTVVMSGAVSEFAAPFEQVGRSTMLLFIIVAFLATLAFSVLLRRTTRSLEALTGAASQVGQGNFAPSLPPPGADEVGRLSAAFSGMVTRIRDMMEEVRVSRQLAVLGEFAAQLSHEVRNPLTSIKLNLQKIERTQREGAPAEAMARPLEIALREVDRLDGVVRGVLHLARMDGGERRPVSLHVLVSEAVELVGDQARAQRVAITTNLAAPRDVVTVDATRIKGALLNLLINGLEAMPAGGNLAIASTGNDESIRLVVSDTGPGIAADQRTAIFRPFATTKPGGTGLGLPLARRALEEHGGTIVADENAGARGARIVLTLPVLPAE